MATPSGVFPRHPVPNRGFSGAQEQERKMIGHSQDHKQLGTQQ